MSLRRRSNLLEATYERDRRLRDIAEDFYEHLYKFLMVRPHELVPRRDGGFSVHAREFWDHNELARNLGVVFTPEQNVGVGRLQGGIGTAGKMDVLVFPIMMGPGNPENLATRLHRDHVVHEMIHLLDPGYKRTRGAAQRKSLTQKAYYNLPGEWNAFWQEGAAAAERMMRNPIWERYPESKAKMFGDGTLKDFMKSTVVNLWDQIFRENMTSKTKRKFHKRLAQLWQAFKNEGML